MRLIVPLQSVFQGPGGLVLGTLIPCGLFYGLQLLRGRWQLNADANHDEQKQQKQNQVFGSSVYKDSKSSAKAAKSNVSTRGLVVLEGGDSPYYLGWKEYERNPYNPVSNPQGCIQLGLAESSLSLELVQHWADANPQALKLQLDAIAGYPNYAGLASLRKAFVGFMQEAMGGDVQFNPDNVVVTAGATAAVEILSFCLGDSASVFLVPAPYYPGFNRDSRWRSGVELVPVPCFSRNGFNVTRASLDAAFNRARKSGKQVRALLVSSPSNPVGNTLDFDTLKLMLDFAREKDLHLISDEIYAGSTFADPGFISIAKVLDSNVEYDRSKVHIIYGTSKDLGLAGFRAGLLYSWNKQVVAIATRLGRFCSVSTQTQCFLAALLSDKQFVVSYLQEAKRRLRQRWEWTVESLRGCGINCAKGNAGFFCWIDLRHLLKAQTEEAETELWSKLLHEVGLNVTPGSACHSPEPGWFRLCFANQSQEILTVAMERLKKLSK